jgi:hypothetical protein
MAEQVELSSLDLRFESYRLKNKAAERMLLASILENGIRDPLQGVNEKDARILLNGFKRYRCAKKLGLGMVPYCSLAEDPGVGIIELLRMSNAKSLSILEQAKLIDELKNVYKMGTAEIARLLEKSKAWVSVRSGIIKEISDTVMDQIMRGQFPVYAYMYIVRPFIRINKTRKEEIDEFVDLVSGKNLSIRDIELLAQGYFRGSDDFRRQMKEGDISWGLNRLKESSSTANECTTIEGSMLKDLTITQKYMQRVTVKSRDTRFKTNSFYARANLLSGGIIRQMDGFNQAIREFHDRSSKAQSDLSAKLQRHADRHNRPHAADRQKDRTGNHRAKRPNAAYKKK